MAHFKLLKYCATHVTLTIIYEIDFGDGRPTVEDVYHGPRNLLWKDRLKALGDHVVLTHALPADEAALRQAIAQAQLFDVALEDLEPGSGTGTDREAADRALEKTDAEREANAAPVTGAGESDASVTGAGGSPEHPERSQGWGKDA